MNGKSTRCQPGPIVMLRRFVWTEQRWGDALTRLKSFPLTALKSPTLGLGSVGDVARSLGVSKSKVSLARWFRNYLDDECSVRWSHHEWRQELRGKCGSHCLVARPPSYQHRGCCSMARLTYSCMLVCWPVGEGWFRYPEAPRVSCRQSLLFYHIHLTLTHLTEYWPMAANVSLGVRCPVRQRPGIPLHLVRVVRYSGFRYLRG